MDVVFTSDGSSLKAVAGLNILYRRYERAFDSFAGHQKLTGISKLKEMKRITISIFSCEPLDQTLKWNMNDLFPEDSFT